MPVRVVVGANWGDEGKGRMVDYFARDADFVVRYQGGSNAGHTIVNDYGTFKLRLVPSGIFYSDVTNVIGPGTVVNIEVLANEINHLSSRGITISPQNLRISDRATLCFPFHMLQDRYEEERLGGDLFGSTLQGIAPAYGDRFMKYGIQVGALLDPRFLSDQLHRSLEMKNLVLVNAYHKPAVGVDEVLEWISKFSTMLIPHICDTLALLSDAAKEGKSMLLEAQLGALRDVYYGIYPYTTSSSPLAGFAYVGAGLFSNVTPKVTAVVKAFSTCVGGGPFVTELKPEDAEPFRKRTGEYGAATGRPRRIGHFDAVATRYGVRIQNASEVALTKLDNLSGEGNLRICTQYSIAGRLVQDFPLVQELRTATPVYTELPGWQGDISSVRRYSDLPEAARHYVEVIEELIKVPVKYVSVGPERDALISR